MKGTWSSEIIYHINQNGINISTTDCLFFNLELFKELTDEFFCLKYAFFLILSIWNLFAFKLDVFHLTLNSGCNIVLNILLLNINPLEMYNWHNISLLPNEVRFTMYVKTNMYKWHHMTLFSEQVSPWGVTDHSFTLLNALLYGIPSNSVCFP